MKRVLVIVCFALSLHFGTGMLRAEDAKLIAAARNEGRVVWYTVAGESQQLAQDFGKKYPFVKVEVVRSTVYPLLTRILNEARAGNYFFDVVRQSTFTIGLLNQKGLTAALRLSRTQGLQCRVERQGGILDLDRRQLFCRRLQYNVGFGAGSAKGLGGPLASEMARADWHGS